MRSEHQTVDGSDPGVVVIRQTKVIDGVDLSGILPVDRANVAWLRQAIEAVKNGAYEDQVQTAGGDALMVFGGGHDSAPVVNVHNRRSADGPFGGVFARGFLASDVDQLLADLAAA